MTDKIYILNEKNQHKLDEFIKFKRRKSLRDKTYSNLESNIRKVLALCNNNWDEITINDLDNVFDTIKGTSKELIKSQTKQFFKFCGKKKQIADKIHVNFSILTTPTKDATDILNEQEIKDFINKQNDEYYRALAEVSIITGGREKAFSNLNWNHFRIVEGMPEIYFIKDGKDLEGWLKIIPYLSNPTQIYPKNLIHFWENHKFKGQNDKPLFYSTSSRNLYGRTKPNSFYKIFIRMGKTAGITKQTNPQYIRHTTASYCGKDFTERLLEKQIGWKAGSKMPIRYCHEQDKMLDSRKLELAGLNKKEVEKGIECSKCHEINLKGSERCKRCNTPLTFDLIYKEYEEKDKKYLDVTKRLEQLEEMLDNSFLFVFTKKQKKELESGKKKLETLIIEMIRAADKNSLSKG